MEFHGYREGNAFLPRFQFQIATFHRFARVFSLLLHLPIALSRASIQISLFTPILIFVDPSESWVILATWTP